MKNKKTIPILLIVAGLMLIIYGSLQYFTSDANENTLPKEEEKDKDDDSSKEEEPNQLLLNYHKKMQTSDSLNGYTSSIRLMGFSEEGKEAYDNGDIITIENYMNKKYRISERNTKTSKESYLYVTNDAVYMYNEDEEKYEKTDKKPGISNPLIYMETLKTGKDVTVEEKVVLDEKEYIKYTYISKQGIVNEILKNTASKDLAVKEDVETIILIDSNGYISSIEYNLGRLLSPDITLTLQVKYYEINNAIDYGFGE